MGVNLLQIVRFGVAYLEISLRNRMSNVKESGTLTTHHDAQKIILD